MVVKGSEQYRTVVVPYRPGQRIIRVVTATIIACLLTALCLWVGYQEAQRAHKIALQEWDELQAKTNLQGVHIQQLEMQISNSDVGASVDKQALEVLRKQMVQLNEKIAILEESNNFYRGLMEPKSALKGLAIGSFTLTPATESGKYHYQLVAQQFAKNPRLLKARANVTFIGTQGSEAKSYPLHELSEQVSELDIPLKFRFYQSIEGDIVLPEGFELLRTDVLVEKKGSSTPVVRSFEWQKNTDQTH